MKIILVDKGIPDDEEEKNVLVDEVDVYINPENIVRIWHWKTPGKYRFKPGVPESYFEFLMKGGEKISSKCFMTDAEAVEWLDETLGIKK